jgi:cerevisin
MLYRYIRFTNCVLYIVKWYVIGSVAGNTIGVATGVNTYGLKSLSDAGFGLSSASIEAMEMVIERHQSKPGARSVINMSLGSGCTNAYCAQDSSVIAVQNCVNAGIVVVTAAGNDFCNSCFFSPAAAVNGITVGATTIEDDIAYFSNFGQCIDMWAPG